MRFTFAGTEYEGREGETLAAALVRNGVLGGFRSLYRDRPRGVYTAGEEEPNALVQIGAQPMLRATLVALEDGLVAEPLAGKGRLVAAPDDTRYDTMHAHCDVLVVGAGRSGRRGRRGGERTCAASRRPPRNVGRRALRRQLRDRGRARPARLADPREADRARDRRDRAARDLPRQRPARRHARRRLRAVRPPRRRDARSPAAGARASTSGARPAAACAGTTGSARPCPTASCAGSSASAG